MEHVFKSLHILASSPVKKNQSPTECTEDSAKDFDKEKTVSKYEVLIIRCIFIYLRQPKKSIVKNKMLWCFIIFTPR